MDDAPPSPCTPRWLPELTDMEEIQCKRWCHLVIDPGFRLRFHQFHYTPHAQVHHLYNHAPSTTTRFLAYLFISFPPL
jgi:hypothetical protein